MKQVERYIRHILLLIIICVGSGALMAQGIDFRRFTLPCGVRVLLHSNPHAPVVSVGLMYRSGLNDQPSNLEGINDMVALLRINSSRHLEDGEYADILETYGGNSMYSVGHDVTFFCDNFSANMLNGAIWLAAEKTAECMASEEEFEKYYTQVKRNLKRGVEEKTDVDLLYDMVQTVNMRLVTQFTEYDEGLDLSVVQHYERAYFTPDKAVLAISGMIDIDSTAKAVKEMFAFLPDTNYGEDVRPSFFTVNNAPQDSLITHSGNVIGVGDGILAVRDDSYRVDKVYRRTDRRSVIMAWQIPPYTDPQAEVFDFIGTVLAAQGGRLREALMKESNMAVGVEYIGLPMSRASVFAIKITADDDIPLSDIVQEVNSQMETLKMRNITQEELIQALNTSSMAMWQDISTNEGMVRYLSSAELMYGNASVMNSRLDRMNRITADEVREVVHRFLRADNMKTFYILPSSMKK